ncbi:MAG TPA: hypothetical protein VNZ03_22515 [Terriglobales bacterium]|nr:hypothetical protein [Terriglobales bacterium]
MERRALPPEVVAQESEIAALRKDCGFIMDGAVLKSEYQVARHPIATEDLDQVTVGEGFTLHSAQQQKAVDQALGATRGYLRRKQIARLEQSYADQEDGKRFGSDIF